MSFDVRDLLTLSTVPRIGPSRLIALVSRLGDPAAVARASARTLAEVDGIDRKLAATIAEFYRNSGSARARQYVDEQLSRLNKVEGRIVSFWDKEYPENLKKIFDPPPLLFVRGALDANDRFSIAIVGTRTPSQAGSAMAARFAAELCNLGLPIVSGLARGIDTVAHTAAVKNNGRTIAVIGSGIDVIYPPENKRLVELLLDDGGALISEFEMGAKPDAGNFPRRNRVISGIALATLIVETGIEGGAMITAATALDQNRDVFAIPWSVNEKRRSGTNKLIKDGKAILTESVDDILAELGPRLKRIVSASTHTRTEKQYDLTLFERKIYDALGDEPAHIDLLAQRAALATSEALVHLLSMEFKGAVRQLPGKMFVRA